MLSSNFSRAGNLAIDGGEEARYTVIRRCTLSQKARSVGLDYQISAKARVKSPWCVRTERSGLEHGPPLEEILALQGGEDVKTAFQVSGGVV
jgi:hypothetical protein